jgi:hypothetical protein
MSARLLFSLIAIWLGFSAVLAVALSFVPSDESDAIASFHDETITPAQLASARKAVLSSQQPPLTLDGPDYAKCVAAQTQQLRAAKQQVPAAEALRKQCAQVDTQVSEQALTGLIQAAWLRAEADDLGITVTEAEAAKAFTEQKKQAFPKAADYDKYLKTSGRTEAELLDQVRSGLIAQKLQQHYTKAIAAPSDAELRKLYDEQVKTMPKGSTAPEFEQVRDQIAQQVLSTKQQPILAAALKSITDRSRPHTECLTDLKVEQCNGVKPKPTPAATQVGEQPTPPADPQATPTPP